MTWRPEASTALRALAGAIDVRHGRDLAVLDPDVADGIEPVLRVDDPPALDQEVELDAGLGARSGRGLPPGTSDRRGNEAGGHTARPEGSHARRL